MMREHAADMVKVSPLAGYGYAVATGWTITEWAALAAFVYSLLLIADLLRRWGVFNWIARCLSKLRRV